MDLTSVFEAAVALAAAIITAVLIPLIKSKTTAQQRLEISQWVKIAVQAAEQTIKGAGMGEKKKVFVLTWLEQHDVHLDEDKIDAMIEAAVYELNSFIITEDQQGS